jgi:hypothetical protein
VLVFVHPTAETDFGPETVVDVEFRYDTHVLVTASFGISGLRESSAIRAFSVRLEDPWPRAITVKRIQRLVVVARDVGATELAERSLAKDDDDYINSAALKRATRSVPVYTKADYLQFAITVDEVMQLPASAFPINPSGPFGRLARTPWSGFSRRTVERWSAKAREFGLLNDSFRLTPEARRCL